MILTNILLGFIIYFLIAILGGVHKIDDKLSDTKGVHGPIIRKVKDEEER